MDNIVSNLCMTQPAQLPPLPKTLERILKILSMVEHWNKILKLIK